MRMNPNPSRQPRRKAPQTAALPPRPRRWMAKAKPQAPTATLPMHELPNAVESRPRGERVGTWLAWLVIAAVVAFVAYRNWSAARGERVEQATEGVTISMTGRYAVGAHAILRAFPSGAQNSRQLVEPVLAGAKTPSEELRAVTVVAEVQGGPAALDELQRIKPLLKSDVLQSTAGTLESIYTNGIHAVSSERREQLVEQLG